MQLSEHLEFYSDDQQEFEVENIIDSVVYARESEDGKPPGLYYLVHWKGYPTADDTWEPAAGVKHLRRLLRSYHKDNPLKPTANSLAIDSGPPPPLLAKRSTSTELASLSISEAEVVSDLTVAPISEAEFVSNFIAATIQMTPLRSRRARPRAGLDDSVATRIIHWRKAIETSRSSRS